MGDLLGFFNIQSVAKHEKIEENKTFYFREKISMPKKTERGDPLGFSNIHSVAKHQKNAGGPFGENVFFEKKVSQCRKKERGDTWVSLGMVCYAEKQEKPFWFSSLGQIVQFGAIIFCRTFKNYFGQFVWIEKRVTIIVAFHFMKRRLKIEMFLVGASIIKEPDYYSHSFFSFFKDTLKVTVEFS